MMRIIFSAFLLAFSFSIKAQFSIAPILGINYSDLKTVNTDIFKTSPVVRHYIGIQPRMAFSEKFNAGIGVQYATKGFVYTIADSKNATTWKTQNIDFMPFAEYKPMKTFGVFAGGYIGLLLDEKFKSNKEWMDSKIGFVNKTDVGAVIGLRVYANNGFFHLSYSRGIIPIADVNYTDENGEIIAEAKQYTQVVSVGAGYYFSFAKK